MVNGTAELTAVLHRAFIKPDVKYTTGAVGIVSHAIVGKEKIDEAYTSKVAETLAKVLEELLA